METLFITLAVLVSLIAGYFANEGKVREATVVWMMLATSALGVVANLLVGDVGGAIIWAVCFGLGFGKL